MIFAFSVLLSLATHSSVGNAGTDGLAWQTAFDEPVRYFVDSEVHLPQFMWFVADRNRQVRVLAYQTTMVVSCGEAIPLGRRGVEFTCAIEDAAIRAASSRSERNKLGPILQEMTEKMKSGTVQIRLRTTGKLTHLSFEPGRTTGLTNRRTNQMAENLRLILHRAFSGVDLEMPKKETTEEGYWIQYDSAILMAPSTAGTRGAAEIIHRIDGKSVDQISVHTSGQGTLTPGDSDLNFYAMNLEAHGTFNVKTGVLEERSWMCAGQPTASSAFAQGGNGLPYIQKGVLKRVSATAVVNVGETGEVIPNEEQLGLIGSWGTIGAPAGELQQ